MRRASLAVLLIGGLMVAGTSAANAQHGGFGAKSARVGPVIGFGNIGDAGIAIGGRFEKGIKELPNLGNGVLSIMVGADYYKFVSTVKYIPISGTVNYHINTKSDKWGAFVGVGLGYYNVSCSGCSNYSSGLFFTSRIGGSYAVSNALQLYADLGAGAATINAGVMFLLGKN